MTEIAIGWDGRHEPRRKPYNAITLANRNSDRQRVAVRVQSPDQKQAADVRQMRTTETDTEENEA